MLNIGPQELLLILVVDLLVVGPRRLPEIGRSLGKGLREIRKAQDEVRKTIQVNLDDETPRARGRGDTGSPPGDAESDEIAAGGALSVGGAAASEPIGEISKTLGRGLAELRKARREVERSFRVDLDEPTTRPHPRPAASGDDAGGPEPDGSVATDEPPAAG